MLFFNILPVLPLDGYRIVYAVLSIWFDDEYTSDLLFYLSMVSLTFLCIIIFITRSFGLFLIAGFLLRKIIEDRTKQRHRLLWKRLQKIDFRSLR